MLVDCGEGIEEGGEKFEEVVSLDPWDVELARSRLGRLLPRLMSLSA